MRDIKAFLDEFHIGTYFLQRNARSEAHVRDLKDCGIDLVFGMERDEDALALFEKYGVSAVVTGLFLRMVKKEQLNLLDKLEQS